MRLGNQERRTTFLSPRRRPLARRRKTRSHRLHQIVWQSSPVLQQSSQPQQLGVMKGRTARSYVTRVTSSPSTGRRSIKVSLIRCLKISPSRLTPGLVCGGTTCALGSWEKGIWLLWWSVQWERASCSELRFVKLNMSIHFLLCVDTWTADLTIMLCVVHVNCAAVTCCAVDQWRTGVRLENDLTKQKASSWQRWWLPGRRTGMVSFIEATTQQLKQSGLIQFFWRQFSQDLHMHAEQVRVVYRHSLRCWLRSRKSWP